MSAPFDAQRVAGEGVAQLGHGAQVAGVQLGNFDGLAALHDAEVREALLSRGACSSRRGVVLDDAADDFEEADAAREGVGHGLEDKQGQRLAVVDLAGGVRSDRPPWLADGEDANGMGARSAGEGVYSLMKSSR